MITICPVNLGAPWSAQDLSAEAGRGVMWEENVGCVAISDTPSTAQGAIRSNYERTLCPSPSKSKELRCHFFRSKQEIACRSVSRQLVGAEMANGLMAVERMFLVTLTRDLQSK